MKDIELMTKEELKTALELSRQTVTEYRENESKVASKLAVLRAKLEESVEQDIIDLDFANHLLTQAKMETIPGTFRTRVIIKAWVTIKGRDLDTQTLLRLEAMARERLLSKLEAGPGPLFVDSASLAEVSLYDTASERGEIQQVSH